MTDPTWWNASPGELAGDERLFDEPEDDQEPCPDCGEPLECCLCLELDEDELCPQCGEFWDTCECL